MTQTIEEALSQAKFYTDGIDYAFLRLPPTAITAAAGVIASIGEPFGALLVDKDEVTLMIRADSLVEFGQRLTGYSKGDALYRLITIDVVLEPNLVGFMARISAVLAGVNITIMPFAAFSRDHLLVPADSFDAAMQALETLRSIK